MGTQEAPGSDVLKRNRVWPLLWLPASPEAAYGLPTTERHGGLVASPWAPGLRDKFLLSVATWYQPTLAIHLLKVASQGRGVSLA